MSRIVPGFNKPPGQAGTQSDNTGQEAQPTPRTKQAMLKQIGLKRHGVKEQEM